MWKQREWNKLLPNHCCSLRLTVAVGTILTLLVIICFLGTFIFALKTESDRIGQKLTDVTAKIKKTKIKANSLLQQCHNAGRESGASQERIIHAVRKLLSTATSVLNPDDVLGRKQNMQQF